MGGLLICAAQQSIRATVLPPAVQIREANDGNSAGLDFAGRSESGHDLQFDRGFFPYDFYQRRCFERSLCSTLQAGEQVHVRVFCPVRKVWPQILQTLIS